MPTFSHLQSGKWRVQVRKSGIYRAATFATKREASAWAINIEAQVNHIAAGGFAPVPKTTNIADLIDEYEKTFTKAQGKTKTATLKMLKRELGQIKLASLNSVTLRDFVDRRQAAGAGGSTIAGDLSFFSAILKWARHARQIDVNDRLALDARAGLAHRGLNTRSVEREREPTDDELKRIYQHWNTLKRQKIPMPLITDRTEGLIFNAREDSVSTSFTRACQDVEPPIIDLHFHDLRHHATASFFRMGLGIPQVSLLTGHKTWAMLRRYTKITASDVHAAFLVSGK